MRNWQWRKLLFISIISKLQFRCGFVSKTNEKPTARVQEGCREIRNSRLPARFLPPPHGISRVDQARIYSINEHLQDQYLFYNYILH